MCGAITIVTMAVWKRSAGRLGRCICKEEFKPDENIDENIETSHGYQYHLKQIEEARVKRKELRDNKYVRKYIN